MCKEVIQALVSLGLLKCEEEPFGLVLKQVSSVSSYQESIVIFTAVNNSNHNETILTHALSRLKCWLL